MDLHRRRQLIEIVRQQFRLEWRGDPARLGQPGAIRDCASFMGKLMLLVIEVTMDHPETVRGEACNPGVN